MQLTEIQPNFSNSSPSSPPPPNDEDERPLSPSQPPEANSDQIISNNSDMKDSSVKLDSSQNTPNTDKVDSKENSIFAAKGRKNLARFLQYSFKKKSLVVWGNVSLIITTATQIALPYLTGKMIDIMADKKASSDLNNIAFAFIVLGVISSVFSFIRVYAFDLLGEEVMLQLRNELFSSFLTKDVEFYDTNKSGELMSRISSDTSVVQSAASDSISVLIRNLIQFIGSFIILWFISYELTLVLFIIVPPLILMIAIFVIRFKKFSKSYQDKLAVGNAFANEAFGNIRIVKSFAREMHESKRFLDFMNETFTFGKKKSLLYGQFLGVVTFLGEGALLGVIWYGGTMVIDGKITTGQLSSFILYTITFSAGLLAVGGISNQIITAVGVSEKLFEMIDVPIGVKSGVVTKETLSGNIKFSDVTFEYPTKKDVEVLKNINFEAKKGEVVALVGSSGSGKSSTVSLVERFYDVKKGSITIDGVDIREYDLDWLHEQIGFVSQEPTLFSGTLRENITYGVMTSCTQQQIDNSLEMANAKDFVYDTSVFPEGLSTVVGERGVKLSGGQKQRIAIARALIKDPRILIFDEATSALDAESEFHVQKAIDNLMKQGQKTIILIAHRLSTIRDADKIIVFSAGEIKEIGSHKQLLQIKDGFYAKLISRQMTSNKGMDGAKTTEVDGANILIKFDDDDEDDEDDHNGEVITL